MMRGVKSVALILGVLITAGILSCNDNEAGDLTMIPYAPTLYEATIPEEFLTLGDNGVREDNRMTVEGIELGRHLFYDPILSIDSSISCSSCHQIDHAFSDPSQFSEGVNGTLGTRHSMSLLNTRFPIQGLFWDGRVFSLEEQAQMPIQNDLEMANTSERLENALRKHETYPTMFRLAFGIDDKEEISIELVAKAIAQFERTMVSGGLAKYDLYVKGEYQFSEEEQRGFDLFFNQSSNASNPMVNIPDLPVTNCSNCHTPPLFTSDQFSNNGLDTRNDIIDGGLGVINGSEKDIGKFRVTSLRNIALHPPYMHDGRFANLEEVIDHYDSGGKPADNLDANIQAIGLSGQQKSDLIAFLQTLTDTSYLSRSELYSPF